MRITSMVPCDYTRHKAINDKVERNQVWKKQGLYCAVMFLKPRAEHVNLFCTDQELVITLTQEGFEYFYFFLTC